jgi:hypothetical protein
MKHSMVSLPDAPSAATKDKQDATYVRVLAVKK